MKDFNITARSNLKNQLNLGQKTYTSSDGKTSLK